VDGNGVAVNAPNTTVGVDGSGVSVDAPGSSTQVSGGSGRRLQDAPRIVDVQIVDGKVYVAVNVPNKTEGP
jgi:hypothetical protein